MVERMVGPDRTSASALAREVGVGQSTLSRWHREAHMGKGRGKKGKKDSKSPRIWSAEDKLRVVQESLGLSEEDLGAYLRREGLHEAQLREWRQAVLGALRGLKKGPKKSPEAKKVRELERELYRKDKALAEVTALLALKKKVQELWGDEDESTAERNGR
jgi:transposase-like protein